jgi:dihydroflavonol-4-reductase
MALPQGDLRLLESDVAQRLLASTIPARVAYIARNGTPRVVPTWFHCTPAPTWDPRPRPSGSPAAISRPARRSSSPTPARSTAPTTRTWGDGLRRIRNILKGRYPIAPSGGYPIADVRDVAKVHAAVLEPGRGLRRYLAGGTFLRFADVVARLGAVTGRRLRAVTVPAGMLLPAGRAVQLVQRIVPVHIPVEFEAVYFCWCAARCDDTRTRTELGVAPRDIQVTLADSVRWLFEQDHISRRQAGQLPTV